MKKISLTALLALISLPKIVSALGPPEDVQTFGVYLVNFITIYVVALMFGVSLLIFIYNIIRYFILENDSYSGKEDAKRYALYSIIGMVLMTIIWGVVNLVVGGLGFARTQPVCPDIFTSEECASMQPGGFGAADFGNDPLGEFGGAGGFSSPELDAAKAIVTTAVSARLSDLPIDYGNENVSAVTPLINSTYGLLTTNTATNPADHQALVNAAKRLETSGLLSSSAAARYINAINSVRTIGGLPNIFPDTNLSVPLTADALASIDATKADLRIALIDSLKDDPNRSGTANGTLADEETEADRIITDLYSASTDEQVVIIDGLFDNEVIFPAQQGDLYNEFINDLNMINLFKGLPPVI